MAVGFILITTETGAEFDVREAVSRIEGVVGQWIVLGPHDLFVKVEAEGEAELTECTVPGVRGISASVRNRTLPVAET